MTAAVIVLAVAAASAIAALVWMAAKHYASVNDYYAQLRNSAIQREQIAALTGERNTYLVRATKAEYELALMTKRFNDATGALLKTRQGVANARNEMARNASPAALAGALDELLAFDYATAKRAVPGGAAADRDGDDEPTPRLQAKPVTSADIVGASVD